MNTTATSGHNSGGVEHGPIKAFVERIENLEGEIKALNDDKRDVYSEAKGTGFDVAVLKKVIAIRRLDENKRRETEEILDLYLTALGML